MAVAQSKPIRSLTSRKIRLLHKIDDKLYAMSARLQREPMLYLAEAQLFAWLCGQSWAQRCYWATKGEIVHRFLSAINLPLANSRLTLARVIQQAFFCELFFQRWYRRLRTWQPQQLAQVVTAQGWEAWLAAYQQKKGVILLPYHTLAARLLLPWLAHAGVGPLLGIGAGRNAHKGAELSNLPFFHARQLHAAQSCLVTGGVVLILPDGFHGRGGVALPIYGRTRFFRTTFAELALLTGAVIVPVSAILDLRGRITMTFHPPLNAGDKSQSRSEQLEALIKQYTAFLQAEWRAAPGNITLGHMARFLANSTPIVQEGTINDVD